MRLGKDYLGAIRARLEEEYHSAGYARVELFRIRSKIQPNLRMDEK